MKFLTCEKREEFKMVAEKNAEVGKAVAVLMELSEDEQTRLLEESREKFRRDSAARMQGEYERGEKKGEKKGQKELISLLESGKSLGEAKRILGIE
jgi:hypothetical protein